MVLQRSIKWGIYLGLVVVAGTQILTWLGLGLTNWFVGLTYVAVIICIALGLRAFKKSLGSKIPFGKAILFVLLTILISRIIFQLYMFIYVNYLDPNWIEMVAESWTKTMQEASVAEEVINKRIDRFRQAYEPISMFTITLIQYAIPQFILGFIVSLFYVIKLKRN